MAQALHNDALVVDAHSDVFSDVARRRAFGERQVLERLHVPAWRAGGVDAVVTTLYTEPEHKPDRALRRAMTVLGSALEDIAESESVTFCRARAELETAHAAGKIAFILAMEGGEPLHDVSTLAVFRALGLRVLGLTWNQRNQLAEGVGEERSGGGLTELGREMVRAAGRLGVVVDTAHLTPRSFWQVLEEATGPVIDSHANAKALCPHPRNLDDDQIRAIGERGGVVGICAVARFTTEDPSEATLERMLDHLDHVTSLIGPEHVALGPDFVDYLRVGPGAWVDPDEPVHATAGFGTISELPNVTEGLLRRGYSEADVRGILGGNLLRVLDAVW